MVLNPNGVMFGTDATVNVGGLIASTGLVDDSEFMAGDFSIAGASVGSISNQGIIKLSDGGLAAFIAPSVSNSGTITADNGRISLASVQSATIALNGGLYEVALTQALTGGSIDNSGTLNAGGGAIALSAMSEADLLSSTINLSGVQQANSIVVDGDQIILVSDLDSPSLSGNSKRVSVQSGAQIQDGIDIVRDGATVDVATGTYTQTSTLNINKELELSGAARDEVIIDARSIGNNYGISVSASNVSLNNFTLYGSASNTSSAYGIKVSPGGAADSRLSNFSINQVVSRGAGRAELDLNGVNGATISDFIADGAPIGDDTGSTNGAGIQLTDTANVTVSRTTTRNNAWGGVALYQANRSYNQQTGNITIAADNDFTESNPLYAQGGSLINDFGTLTLNGYSFAVQNETFRDASGYHDGQEFTFFQKTEQDAVDFALSLATPKDSVTRRNSSATYHDIDGDGNLDADGEFIVGANATQSMSIAAAINAADPGATINVRAGTYDESLNIGKALTLSGAGAGESIIAPTSLTADDAGLYNILTIGGGSMTNVEVSGFTIKGPVANVNNGILVRDGAQANIHHNQISDIRPAVTLGGAQRGIGILVGFASIESSGRAEIRDNVISGYQKGGIVVDGVGSEAIVSDNTVIGAGPTDAIAQNGIQISRGASATVEGNRVSAHDYSPASYTSAGILIFTPGVNLDDGEITINANTVTGNEIGISTNDPRTLAAIDLTGVNLNTRNARAFFSGGFTGAGTLLEYPAWDAPSTALANADSSAVGDIFDFNGTHYVAGWNGFSAIQPALDAVAVGGLVNVAAGTYAENVVVNAPRDIYFAGETIANSFTFNAPITLQGDTTLSTLGGDIAFYADIQGSGRALNLFAGSNDNRGDVVMTSGGSEADPLGPLAVSAQNYDLQGTLWVDSYSIDAGADVALSSTTLRALGMAVTNKINAGGNISGSSISNAGTEVVGSGNVAMNITSAGAASVQGNHVEGQIDADSVIVEALGDIVATVNAVNEIAVTAQGNIAGKLNANVVAISAGGNVAVNLDADNSTVEAVGQANLSGLSSSVTVNASGGSFSGDFKLISNVGDAVVVVNGRPEVSDKLANSNYIQKVLPAQIKFTESGTTLAVIKDAGLSAPRTHFGELLIQKRPDAALLELDRGVPVEIDLSPNIEARDDNKPW